MTSPYPLGLMLAGRRVLMVGGGTVASRRVPALLDAGADLTVVAPAVTTSLRALAEAGRLRWEQRGVEPADLEDVWLVHVAVDDPAAAAMVSAEAERRRVFCVRADDRHEASAWTPAVTRHGPVTVAVTAGGDPRRAMAVRDAIRDGLAEGRVSAAKPPPPDRSGAEGSGRTGAAQRSEPEASVTAGRVGQPGTVALVGSGPGDPELITVKGRRLLAEADVVVVDRLVPGLLLDELRADVELIDASKIPYGESRAQDEINRLLVEHALKGRFVVRLKGGDPFVFGRGGEEVIACAEAGVAVTVVPGVTSAVAAPAMAGIPVTHRAVAHEVAIVSGHVPPGHPDSRVDWEALAKLRGTVCVLMGLKNLDAIAATLLRHGRSAHTPVGVVQEGTTPGQRVLTATLETVAAEVAAAGLRPPAVVVIGDVVTALAPSR